MKARPLPTEKIFGVANFASTTKISIKFRLYYAGTPACTLDTNKKLGCVLPSLERNRTQYRSKIQRTRYKGKTMRFICIQYSQKDPFLL